MSTSTAPTVVKISVLLDANGSLVGASSPREYKPAEGEEKLVTAGHAAGPGQSLVDVEVPAQLADLSTSGILARLSEQDTVRKVLASVTTSGAAPVTSESPHGFFQSPSVSLTSSTGPQIVATSGGGVVSSAASAQPLADGIVTSGSI